MEISKIKKVFIFEDIFKTLVLIAVGISIIIPLSIKKKNETIFKSNNAKFISWDEAFKESEKFISKLNLTERINLLFGIENMKPILPKATEEDRQYKCDGQIDLFDNEEINFKGMCLQDGPSGINYLKELAFLGNHL